LVYFYRKNKTGNVRRVKHFRPLGLPHQTVNSGNLGNHGRS